MSPITKYYTQSELAYAAYVDMLPGVDPVPALTGDTVGMPETQATNFAENWQVVDQFNDELRPGYVGLYSGLSVTLFENLDSGDQVVAIRGTNDLRDLGTDIEDILLRGTGKYQAQYSALNDKVQEWLDDGTMGRSVRMPYCSARLEPGRCKASVRRGRVIPASSDGNAADAPLKARPSGPGEPPVLGVAPS